MLLMSCHGDVTEAKNTQYIFIVPEASVFKVNNLLGNDLMQYLESW